MTEVVALLENVPGGWIAAIILLLVFGPPAILSKTAAEKFGLFGSIARWWRNRKLVQIEQADKQKSAEVAILERRVVTLEEHIKKLQAEQNRERQEYLAAAAEDRKQWRDALDSAEKEIEEVRSGLRVRDRGMFELYDWTIRARVKALDGGVVLPPIPEITYLSVGGSSDLPKVERNNPPADTVDP